jgi:hypothetical protein
VPVSNRINACQITFALLAIAFFSKRISLFYASRTYNCFNLQSARYKTIARIFLCSSSNFCTKSLPILWRHLFRDICPTIWQQSLKFRYIGRSFSVHKAVSQLQLTIADDFSQLVSCWCTIQLKRRNLYS